ncbi:MAG: cytidylate kinase-like family protein [Alloprevotella sp.]|nr:cytidylate kinase-like family protein [Alloprevotella sp.]
MQPFIINVGRQLGAGGRQVGRLLSTEFGLTYYDHEILTIAAKESGYCEEVFRQKDERKGFVAQAIRLTAPFTHAGSYYHESLSDEELFRFQSEAIRKAAAQGNCIFIGRAADYVLRDFPRCLNIFLTADHADRVRAIMKRRDVDEKTATSILRKGDNRRAQFYNYYTAKTWGAAETYDFCLNTSRLGIEGTAQLIAQYIRQRFT